MLMCDSTVTLVRKSADGYDCTVFPQASVYGSVGVSGSDEPENVFSVRICGVTDGNMPTPGDYIALGAVYSADSLRSLAGRTYFRVTEVTDSRRGSPALRHVRVRGK